MDDDLKDLRSEMKAFFSSLSGVVEQHFNDIKLQNSEMRVSLQFLSDKYDDMAKLFQGLEEERKKDNKYISQLEEILEVLERKSKSSGLEIRNVPSLTSDHKKPETKEEITTIVKSMAMALEVELQDYDVKDVYRVNSKKGENKPIIVELNSAIKKEKIIQAIKELSRTKGVKLNTEHFKIPGPVNLVYVTETLTIKTQKIYYMAREFARQNGYSYCCTSKGQVYLRKADASIPHRVRGGLREA
ncbi:unnamed protein product [Chilo suppressalis]|uniref:Zinc finger DNA binding protein n=1 Tax=Chilo suppressalis TaxID=168631 RepID=A0ABN8AZD7_CHISP|nr:unnamed protein product [Chilo suppressalis]